MTERRWSYQSLSVSKMFERDEDRFLPRNERRVKADVHFWDETIGKVDIPTGNREKNQKTLRPQTVIFYRVDRIRDQTRRRTIIVKVYIKLVDDYTERVQMVKNPMVAFFKIVRFRGFYDKKNRLIQDVLKFD
ncbi:hypothetical protein B9Z55_021863 [Caenorhabditis nigoni]|uniref:DUF7040 domain-containing protein n=1 Tax=Caenorhabditis nigoni TaxID=1611254 RepID=A0A2G5TTX0_9PELO|nr:hypothetical protein B9Z55_021863 [Caenorhabditis nigoni]